MTRKKIVILILLTTSSNCFAQYQFQRTIGGTGDDRANCIIQTTDGGYAVAGYSNSFRVWSDFYIVKLNSNGSLQWTRAVEAGTNNSLKATSIIQTSDGGYAVAGSIYIYSAGTYYDVFIVKFDANGSLQWSKAINGTFSDDAASIIQTSDGGYAVAGSTTPSGMLPKIYLVKLDGTGNPQWSKTIAGTGQQWASSIIQTTDGGYALAGATSSFGAGSLDYYIVKLDSVGSLQWNKTIGGNNEDRAYSIIQNTAGEYVVAGYTYSFGAGGYNVYVIKFDNSGSLIWSRTIGNSISSIYAYSIIQTADLGYTVGGSILSNGSSGYLTYSLKIDASGIFQWNKTLGGGGRNNGANTIAKTTDNGFAIAGYTTTDTSGSVGDMYIVKFDSTGNTCGTIASPSILMGFGSGTLTNPIPTITSVTSTVTTPPVTVISGGSSISICLVGVQSISNQVPDEFRLYQNYPNPFNPSTIIKFEIANLTNSKLIIYNTLGQEIAILLDERLKPGSYEVEWNASSYPSGIYYCRLTSGKFSQTEKMMLLK